MKECSYCHALANNDETVCSYCGKEQLRNVCDYCQVNFDGDVCPKCGKRIDEPLKICPNCGKKAIGAFCPACKTELDKPVPEKGKFRKKWDNHWYHYKWATWGAVFAAIVLFVAVKSCVDRPKYDYQVTLVTQVYYSEQLLDEMAKEFERFGEDIDGNGTVAVQVINLNINVENANPQMEMAMRTKFQGGLLSGESMIYIVDEVNLEMSEKEGFFEYNGGDPWSWEGSGVEKRLKEKNVTGELHFATRVMTGTKLEDDKKIGERYEAAKKLLDRIIKDEPAG